MRGMGLATASTYSISKRASTQPPRAVQMLGLFPPITVSTVAVTPQALENASKSGWSSTKIQLYEKNRKNFINCTNSIDTETQQQIRSCLVQQK